MECAAFVCYWIRLARWVRGNYQSTFTLVVAAPEVSMRGARTDNIRNVHADLHTQIPENEHTQNQVLSCLCIWSDRCRRCRLLHAVFHFTVLFLYFVLFVYFFLMFFFSLCFCRCLQTLHTKLFTSSESTNNSICLNCTSEQIQRNYKFIKWINAHSFTHSRIV